jgi:uncharacterized protein YlxW (UPF0749 family)
VTDGLYGDDEMAVRITTESADAREDVRELTEATKDLNAELEYTLGLLDELQERTDDDDSILNDPLNNRLRRLEKRHLHGRTDE